jgi:hypothetical protein
MSQLYKFSELRTYNAAARSRNGVVGSKGRKIPITPKTNEMLPKIIRIYFIFSLIFPA